MPPRALNSSSTRAVWVTTPWTELAGPALSRNSTQARRKSVSHESSSSWMVTNSPAAASSPRLEAFCIPWHTGWSITSTLPA